MDLTESFKEICKHLSTLFKGSCAVRFGDLKNKKTKKQKNGDLAVLSFEGYKIEIMYIKNGKFAYRPYTLWLTVLLDSEPLLPFSIYDILTELCPGDFKSYTYTEIDNDELMTEAFGEISALLYRIVPLLTALINDGVRKNKLIASRKSSINDYYGDTVFAESENIGGAVEKIREVMADRFFSDVLYRTVTGAVSLFFAGEHTKAQKLLAKSKYRSQYENALLAFLSTDESKSFFAAPLSTDSIAKAKKNSRTAAKKNALCTFKYVLMLIIPVFFVSVAVYYALCAFIFRGADLTIGISAENAAFSALASFPFTVAISAVIAKRKADIKKSPNAKKQHVPTEHPTRLAIIVAETFFIVICFSAVMNTAAFYDTYFTHSENLISVTQTRYEYEYVDCVYKLEGYYFANSFQAEPFYIIKMKSNDTADLYDITVSNCEEFEKQAIPLLSEKNIAVKYAKCEEDIE